MDDVRESDFMKIMRAWQVHTDGTLRLGDVGWSLEAGDTWGICRDAKPSPTSEKSWLYEFGKLIGAAAKVDECISDPRCRRHLGEEGRCPIKSMLGWTVRSRRIIGEIAQPLKMARIQLPTPPEFKGTIGQPFCELAIQLVEKRCLWLKRSFVAHSKESVRLPIDDRVADEAAKIVAHWDEVLKLWKFPAINVEEWMRLIELELSTCHWPDGPIGNSKPRTESVTVNEIQQKLAKKGVEISVKRLNNKHKKAWGDRDGKKGSAFTFDWRRIRNRVQEQFDVVFED